MSLRPYQKKAKFDISSAWCADDIVFLVLATGGGKTVIFTDVIKDHVLDGKRVMLIAHREELINQAWNTLYRNKIYAGIIQSRKPEDFSLPVQVCSIQTIARRKNLPHADLIVIDEGHHVTKDNSYGKILARYTDSKVLIVSATPYRLSGEGFTEVVSGKETKLIVNSTLKSLIDDGWLVPLKYYLSSIPDLSSVSLSKGDYNEEETSKVMKLAPIVESYQQNANGKRGVCFSINIAHSKDVVHQYNMAGIPAAHLDANSSKEYRTQIFEDFRSGKLKVISNVGIITEGFDFPDLEFVQLARPTKSLSMFLQMVGRVTRPQAGVVDKYDHADIRKKAIEVSTKPFGIVLDNAGCWLDHGLPDSDHNWEYYFNGAKKAKKKEEESLFEMMVFIAEDAKGNRVKAFNAKEVEGMKLIEVTRSVREKVINLKSIKEFDKQYEIAKKLRHVKKPAYVAFENYKKYCAKHNYLIVPEVWDYIEKRLILDIADKLREIEYNRSKYPDSYPVQMYNDLVKSIQNRGISRHFLRKERATYESQNESLIKQYLGRSVKI